MEAYQEVIQRSTSRSLLSHSYLERFHCPLPRQKHWLTPVRLTRSVVWRKERKTWNGCTDKTAPQAAWGVIELMVSMGAVACIPTLGVSAGVDRILTLIAHSPLQNNWPRGGRYLTAVRYTNKKLKIQNSYMTKRWAFKYHTVLNLITRPRPARLCSLVRKATSNKTSRKES